MLMLIGKLPRMERKCIVSRDDERIAEVAASATSVSVEAASGSSVLTVANVVLLSVVVGDEGIAESGVVVGGGASFFRVGRASDVVGALVVFVLGSESVVVAFVVASLQNLFVHLTPYRARAFQPPSRCLYHLCPYP